MKSVLRMYLLLFAALVLLVLASGCRQSEVPETVPVALPTFAPPLSMKTLSSAEIQQLDAFQVQLQKIDRDWDQFQRDFDSWRAALTSCSRNAAEEALQSFAVDFNAITEQARDLSRSEVTRAIADSLIDASESEETAFRQLRDRWQPNSPSVFESVEKSRSQSARIQREARDKSEELKDNLEDKTDPDALTEVMEFSDSFGPIEVEWTKLHDEYAVYWQVSETLGSEIEASKLESFLERLASLFVEVDSLPEPAALREELESLRRAANSESSALEELLEVLTIGKQETRALPVVPATPSVGPPSRPVTLPLETVDDAFRASEATIRDTERSVRDILNGDAEEDLQDLESFIEDYKSLIDEWEGFYAGYNEWKKSEGSCDRGEVLQSIGKFKTQIDDIAFRVRDLPRSGYLLSVYNLIVDAAVREGNAVRTLQNTWQPFTVDAFIAVDRERQDTNELRREADIALQELQDRVNAP